MDHAKAEKDTKDAFQVVVNELTSKGVNLSTEQKDIIGQGILAWRVEKS